MDKGQTHSLALRACCVHLQAFSVTAPSVSAQDRAMYDSVYQSFRSGKPQGMLTGSAGNRVALK